MRLFAFVARVLPRRAALACGRGLGSFICRIWGRRRRIAQDNLRRAYGGALSEAEIARIARQTFQTMGQTAVETLRFGRTRPDDLLARVEGNPAVLHEAMKAGKGAVLVSGHFGNWEVFGAWIRALGFEIDVVVKPMRNPLVDSFYNQCRAAMGVGVIHTQVATKQIVRSLAKRRFVAILADQYTGAEGIDVEFFGRPASTPRGPAALALRFGCPILSGVMVQSPEGRFSTLIDGPIEYDATGDTERDVRAITQELTTRLERNIRGNPGQWLWTHRRWRD
ncbi:MAG: lauroyl/myristoyl acyltransferase [Candidatus Zixiibacteriota bacterium]